MGFDIAMMEGAPEGLKATISPHLADFSNWWLSRDPNSYSEAIKGRSGLWLSKRDLFTERSVEPISVSEFSGFIERIKKEGLEIIIMPMTSLDGAERLLARMLNILQFYFLHHFSRHYERSHGSELLNNLSDDCYYHSRYLGLSRALKETGQNPRLVQLVSYFETGRLIDDLYNPRTIPGFDEDVEPTGYFTGAEVDELRLLLSEVIFSSLVHPEEDPEDDKAYPA